MMYQMPVTIEHTLKKIKQHEIVLPAIQREFVWQPEQICTLFDSLMQGYPFGTFLYWKIEQRNNNNYKFYGFVRDYHEKDNPHCPRLDELPNQDVTAVLDGQQRLTALNIALRGSMAKKLPWKKRNNPEAYPQKHLYIDLHWAPDDEDDIGMKYRFEFRTSTESGNGSECWFAVKDIMELADSGPAMTEWLENQLPSEVPIAPAHTVLHRLYTVIREKTLVSFYEESSQELEKVLQIFIRTNSGGTVLSYSDLLLSVAVAQWSEYDAREEIHQLVDDLNKIGNGFKLSKDWVLKAGLMLGGINVGFKVDNFNLSNMATLENQWIGIKRALMITIELASNFGFKAETLGADSALLPIAYYLYVTGKGTGYLTKSCFISDRRSIRKWLISSLLKTGIWGSGLDSLLTALGQVIQDNHDDGFPVAKLHIAMNTRGKSLAFTKEEIEEVSEMRYGDRRTFSLLSLMFDHLDLRYHFHIDHIFPKSLFTPARLREAGFPDEEVQTLREMADSLPNLQLLSGTENREKRSILPAEWLATFKSDEKRAEYVNMHLLGDVPTDLFGFAKFYSNRKNELKSKIQNLLRCDDKPEKYS